MGWLGNPNGAAALRRAKKGNVAAVATVQHHAKQRALETLRQLSRLFGLTAR
jgi:hypothetical protein